MGISRLLFVAWSYLHAFIIVVVVGQREDNRLLHLSGNDDSFQGREMRKAYVFSHCLIACWHKAECFYILILLSKNLMLKLAHFRRLLDSF
jgi:hypothetical protein